MPLLLLLLLILTLLSLELDATPSWWGSKPSHLGWLSPLLSLQLPTVTLPEVKDGSPDTVEVGVGPDDPIWV